MRSPLFDEFDRALLRLLQADSDRTLHELGKAVCLSGPAVQRRIRRLRESGVLLKSAALLDRAKAGAPITVLNLATLERDNGPATEALRERLENHPNVQQCYELAGNYDLATIVVVPDMSVYRALTDELFSGDENVRRFASHVVLDTIKATLEIPL